MIYRTEIFDIVLAHSDKPWKWKCLSSNPNITFDIVFAHPDKLWDWDYLSSNKLKYDTNLQALHILKLKRIKQTSNVCKWYKFYNW